MKKWKTLYSEYVYKTPFGHLRRDHCELPNGDKINGYYVNEYSDWVNAIVITKDFKVVLVEQYRHAGGDCYFEIPAGKVEVEESSENGIIREVREETGYVSNLAPVKIGEYMVNPATQTNKISTYLFIDAYEAYRQDLDENEVVDVHLYDFFDLEQAIKQNQIKTQLFTAFAFYAAKDYLSEHNLLSQ